MPKLTLLAAVRNAASVDCHDCFTGCNARTKNDCSVTRCLLPALPLAFPFESLPVDIPVPFELPLEIGPQTAAIRAVYLARVLFDERSTAGCQLASGYGLTFR